MPSKIPRIIISFLIIWLVLILLVVGVGVLLSSDPKAFQVFLVGVGVWIIPWIGFVGSLSYKYRDRIKNLVDRVHLSWQIKFVLFATILALLEEIFTTAFTNIQIWLGQSYGPSGYATASTNYLDVVLGHSVIVFIPQFIAWAVLLSRYNFSSFAVFLLYGANGVFAESGPALAGPAAFVQGALWIFVYGLMIYLPAYTTVPQNLRRKPVRWYHLILAFVLPILFALPVMFIVQKLHPCQPDHWIVPGCL